MSAYLGMPRTHRLPVPAQAKFDTVKDRIETKANLVRGVEVGDKALILASLARADELRKDWGDIVEPALIARAQDVLAVIEREAAMQASLRAALEAGGATGTPGRLDITTIDTAALDAVITDALSGRTQIATVFGHNLVATAQVRAGGGWERKVRKRRRRGVDTLLNLPSHRSSARSASRCAAATGAPSRAASRRHSSCAPRAALRRGRRAR